MKKFLDSLRGERQRIRDTLLPMTMNSSALPNTWARRRAGKKLITLFDPGISFHLHGCGLSKVSVARSLAALRSMYKWLAREGLVSKTRRNWCPRPAAKKLPRVPTMEEINGLLNSEMPESAAFPERDRAIFELLYGSACATQSWWGPSWAISKRPMG